LTEVTRKFALDFFREIMGTVREMTVYLESFPRILLEAIQGFVDRSGRNYSQNLATAVSTHNAKAALKNALLCIYMERNKVAHGEIISDEEREVLYVCAAFLQRIVAVALNEFYFIPMQASAKSS
jgi:hypothetical protein